MALAAVRIAPTRRRPTALGDWADDAAFDVTGGYEADSMAAQNQLPASGSFLPGASSSSSGGSGMWATMFSSVFNQGSAAASTFNNTAQGLLASEMARQESKRTRNMLLAVGGVAAVGLLVYFTQKK